MVSRLLYKRTALVSLVPNPRACLPSSPSLHSHHRPDPEAAGHILVPLASLMSQLTGDCGVTTPAMSRVMTTGLIFMLLSVSTGVHLGGYALLLCFTGVLGGANLVATGVCMADRPAPNPIVPMVSGGARALAAFMRRNTAAVGLVVASCAFTVVSAVVDPVLCFGMFPLLLPPLF